MGRPSKLSDKQWAVIEQRHLHGESIRSLAKEFGVGEATVRDRVSAQCAEIKDVAKQIVAVEERLSSLPVSAQVSAHTLADELKAISSHLASAARYGAMTSHRLSAIAHTQTEFINDMGSMEENEGAIKTVMALTRGANDASQIALNLLNANKDQMKSLSTEKEVREVALNDAEKIAAIRRRIRADC